MRFWKDKDESRLERELREQRPQPRDEFVRRLSSQVTPLGRRRLALPKVALVAAVTVVMAASLGTAGALGEGGHAVHSFTSSVASLVSPPKATTPTTTKSSTSSSSSVVSISNTKSPTSPSKSTITNTIKTKHGDDDGDDDENPFEHRVRPRGQDLLPRKDHRDLVKRPRLVSPERRTAGERLREAASRRR